MSIYVHVYIVKLQEKRNKLLLLLGLWRALNVIKLLTILVVLFRSLCLLNKRLLSENSARSRFVAHRFY